MICTKFTAFEFLSVMAGCTMATRKVMFSQQKYNGSEGCIVAFNRAPLPKKYR